MKHLHNACSKACLTLTALPLVLFASAGHSQHKTGLNLEFKLQHEINDKDDKVEGDRVETEFIVAKARWNLSGKMDRFGYKFEYEAKTGEVKLRSVQVDYYLTDSTKLIVGKGFKPIPMSGPHRYFKGDIGMQIATTFEGGSFKIGIAHRKPAKWANGIGGFTTLKTQAIGAEIKGKFGGFEPRLRVATNHVPAEKVLATGYKYHGRDSVAVTVGGIYKNGGTKVEADFGTITRTRVKESLNGGDPYAINPKKDYRGHKVTLTQTFTSQWSGKLVHKGIEVKEDGQKAEEFEEIEAEAIYKPNKAIPLSYYLRLEHETMKKKGKKKNTEKTVTLGAKATPSVVIAKK